MVNELSKGYFPKIGKTKEFEILSTGNLEEDFETPKYAGVLKIEGVEVGDWEAIKRWRFRGELLEATVYPTLHRYGKDYERRKEFFGDKEIERVVKLKNIIFTGQIYYNDEGYEFDLEKITVNGKDLKYKTGKTEWKENYNVPFPSGKIVDVMALYASRGRESNQKKLGNHILDDVERLLQTAEREKLREEINIQVEKQMAIKEEAYQNEMKSRESRKKNLKITAGVIGLFGALFTILKLR